MPYPRRIVIEQPCRIRVYMLDVRLFRSTIVRQGKPDLDGFGSTPFAALEAAIDEESRA